MKESVFSKKNVRKEATGSGNSKVWPLTDYSGKTVINSDILSGTSPKLWSNGAIDNIQSLMPPKKEAMDGVGYLQNRVFNSVGGHSIHMNDNENTLTVQHSEGGGVQIHADGSMTISTPKQLGIETGKQLVIQVGSGGEIVFKGDLKLKVDGDFDVECLNYNVTVNGNKTENVEGSSTCTVGENKSEQIVGGSNVVVGELGNAMYLGGYEQTIKGSFNNNIDGPMGVSASGNISMSSSGSFGASSSSMNLVANNMTVMGSAGNIGGAGIDFYGAEAELDGAIKANELTTTGNIKAPFIIGKLDGTAKYHSGAFDTTWTHASQNTTDPDVKKSSAALVQTYLDASTQGMKTVSVDPGDHIKNHVNQTTNTGGVSKTPIRSAGQARSKLRNPSNRTNTNFITSAQGAGKICPSYNVKVPPAIGRTLNKSSPIRDKDISASDTHSYVPLPSKLTSRAFIADPKWNPMLIDPALIDGKTKVGPGTSISTFLASDDAVNISWVKNDEMRQSIAKYYHLHAKLMQTVQDDNEEFDQYSLKVSEGLYRPGPEEKIEPGSIADLKMKGRAVVYELLDGNGLQDMSKTFDLAAFWMYTEHFEKLILDYDTIDCERGQQARIIVIYPELTTDGKKSEWQGNFSRIVETHYNGAKVTKDELVEVKPHEMGSGDLLEGAIKTNKQNPGGVNGERFNMNQNLNPPHIGYDGSNGKIHPDNLVQIAPAGATFYGSGPLMLRKDVAEQFFKMKAHAARDGVNIKVVAAYRSYWYQHLAHDAGKKYAAGISKSGHDAGPVAGPGRSNHGLGQALDLGGTGVNAWMNKHGGEYGFKQNEYIRTKDPVHWSTTGG